MNILIGCQTNKTQIILWELCADMIGQKEYFAIYWTNQIGCKKKLKKNSLMWKIEMQHGQSIILPY